MVEKPKTIQGYPYDVVEFVCVLSSQLATKYGKNSTESVELSQQVVGMCLHMWEFATGKVDEIAMSPTVGLVRRGRDAFLEFGNYQMQIMGQGMSKHWGGDSGDAKEKD